MKHITVNTYRKDKYYSRHYIWNQSQEKKLKVINAAMPEQGGTLDQGHSGPIEKQ